ncbi:hypothetical protein KBW71_09805 [Hydrogenophaga aromaticivorans]|uniref:hypothetical protein n=1 Tax=Hydrogenophaga aromaticivorans TaxID=2610898 RepID=UPI00159FE177|nr:hypothetical protein [Hydrogenophaga aromaticivorans]MBQ0918734.1 hypothetical protein [Hydrogenophaga aromaticivorans]
MNGFADFLERVLRGLLKLVLVLAALVFVVSFLLAALMVVAGVSLWSLITGRKPAPVVMFSRMREQSQRYTRGVWPGQAGAPAGDVVDVQATEVPEAAAGGSPDQGGAASPGPDRVLR